MKHLSLLAMCVFLFSFPQKSFGNERPTTLVSSYSPTTIVNLIYKNGRLSIKGLTGVGTIQIYSIIGNKVAVFNQVDLYDFQRDIALEPKTMFIVRIETAGEIKTYKLVTR